MQHSQTPTRARETLFAEGIDTCPPPDDPKGRARMAISFGPGFYVGHPSERPCANVADEVRQSFYSARPLVKPVNGPTGSSLLNVACGSAHRTLPP